MEIYHTAVLLDESIDGLNIKPSGTYVDLTFGGGGHSKAILKALSEDGKLIAFDQDKDAQQNLPNDKRIIFVESNFRFLSNFLRYHNEEKVNGILADLGVSSHHFDEAERGFSFRFNGKLDMRMNQQSSLTATKILNEYTAEKLADVFYFYGELSQARRIAKAIVARRKEQLFDTIFGFTDFLVPYIGKRDETKNLAKIFQALRIEVNQEMDVLRCMLNSAMKALKPGGRLVIITYHSLEDRLVKNFFKTGNFEGRAEKDFFGNMNTPLKLVNNRIIIPSKEELERNPRSRSGKLRIAEKK